MSAADAADAFLAAADIFDPPKLEEQEKQLRYPTPGALAKALDRGTVQTPALDLIDGELVEVGTALDVLYARQKRFTEAMDSGMPEEQAVEIAEQEIADAGNTRLILSMPPQEGKTERVGRRSTCWWLMQFPQLRMGIVSYDADHAGRISYMARQDIETFDGTDGEVDLGLRLQRNQRAMSRWLLEPTGPGKSSGGVYAIGIGGGLTGRPLELLIIDDPVKDMRAADSVKQSADSWEWWQTTARPRLAPWAVVIVVATRWHELDLPGRLIAKQEEDEKAGAEHYDQWRVVNIPAQADHDPAAGEIDVLEREPGEYMISARGRSRAQWETTKNATAPRHWSALYQGRPTPGIGEIWLKGWWRRYSEPLWSAKGDGRYWVPGADDVLQSWDMAFKDTDASDYVCGQVWAMFGADSFLIYQVWKRLDFNATLDAFQRVTDLFPQAHRKIVEDKANGPAVISSLKKKIAGIIPATPTVSKTARATAVSPFIRAGNVHLPTMTVAVMEPELSWDPEGFINEATAFPNGSFDDQVDAGSQALAEIYLEGGVGSVNVPQGQVPRGSQGTVAIPRARINPGLPAHQRRLTKKQLR